MKNIFWFIIDSVRAEKLSNDDRDRLEIMDKLDSDFANFKNTYTSAPSTIMSAASMFTGLHTFKIARSYSDWTFDYKKIMSIQHILRKEFEIFSIDNSKRAREMLQDLIYVLPKKYYPNHNHFNNWGNDDVYEIFLNCLQSHSVEKNNFYMCWFDCRHDNRSSLIIEKCLNKIKELNLYKDSLIIINSDHGYPDTNTMHVGSYKLPHDLIMTEDNIRVPLLIKAQGLSPGIKKYNTSLLDIFPTIIDYCELDIKYKKAVDGISLFETNAVKFDNRFIRTDNRLLLQSGKITTLVKGKYKFYYYHDTKKTSLYDLKQDPKEIEDIKKDNKNILDDFYKQYFNQHNSFLAEHSADLRTNFKNSINKYNFFNKKVLFFFCNIDDQIKNIVIDFLDKKKSNDISILKNLDKDNLEIQSFKNKEFVDKKILHYKELEEQKFDIIIVINEKNYYRIIDKKIFKKCLNLNSKIKICLDTNLNINNLFFSKWIYPFLKYKKNFVFYRQDIKNFIFDVVKLSKLLFNEYVLDKPIYTPRMEDIKNARDAKIRAEKNIKSEMPNQKYLIIINGLNKFGGTQGQVFKLCNYFNEQKINFNIYSSDKPKDLKYDLSNYLLIHNKERKYSFFKGVKFIISRLIILPYKTIIINFFEFILNEKKINLNSYDVLISFLTKQNVIILLMKYFKFYNGKIILNDRNNIEKRYDAIIRKIYVFLIKKTKPLIITNSIESYDFFKKNNVKAIFTYNEPPQYRQINLDDRITKIKNTKTIINVGRFYTQKNQLSFIKLYNKSNYLKNNYELKLFGRESLNNYKAVLDEYINKKKLNKKISMDSFNPEDVNRIYNQYPIQFYSSSYEGQNNALLDGIYSHSICLVNEYIYNLYIRIFDSSISKFLFLYKDYEDIEKFMKKLKNDEINIHELCNQQNIFINKYQKDYLTLLKSYKNFIPS